MSLPGRNGGGVLKPEEALRILLADRNFRELVAMCTGWPRHWSGLLLKLKVLWQDEICKVLLAEWVFNKPNVNATFGTAVLALVDDPWVHEIFCSRADLPRAIKFSCAESPYLDARLAANDVRSERRARVALRIRKKYLEMKFGENVLKHKLLSVAYRRHDPMFKRKSPSQAYPRKDDSARRRMREPGVIRRSSMTRGLQTYSEPAYDRHQHQIERIDAFDIASKTLREKASDPETPKDILMWMSAPEFQPYLGVELSSNPASDRDVLLKLLAHKTSHKRIWHAVLTNIAKHPRADHEVLRALLEQRPPPSALLEIAKRDDLNKLLAKEVLEQTNSSKVFELIRRKFPDLA